MPSPKTAREALLQCEAIWSHIAGTEVDDKYTAVAHVLDYVPYSHCPACEYTRSVKSEVHRCALCPIDAWRSSVCGDYYGCEVLKDSPYVKWNLSLDEYERKIAANAILTLIRTSSAYKEE